MEYFHQGPHSMHFAFSQTIHGGGRSGGFRSQGPDVGTAIFSCLSLAGRVLCASLIRSVRRTHLPVWLHQTSGIFSSSCCRPNLRPLDAHSRRTSSVRPILKSLPAMPRSCPGRSEERFKLLSRWQPFPSLPRRKRGAQSFCRRLAGLVPDSARSCMTGRWGTSQC